MFKAETETPATWNNTGGDVRVHLVPAGTDLLDERDLDADGFLPQQHWQVTTPVCGLGIFHGGWSHVRDLNRKPLTVCDRCFPVERTEVREGYGPARKTRKSAQREADEWNTTGQGDRYLWTRTSGQWYWESIRAEVQVQGGDYVCTYVTTREFVRTPA